MSRGFSFPKSVQDLLQHNPNIVVVEHTPNPHERLSIPALAQEYGLAPGWIRKQLKAHKYPAIEIDNGNRKRYLIKRKDFEDYLDSLRRFISND